MLGLVQVEVQGWVLVPGVGLLQLALLGLLQEQSLLFSLPLPSFSLYTRHLAPTLFSKTPGIWESPGFLRG